MVTAQTTQFEEHLQALIALGHSRETICHRLLLSDEELDRELDRCRRAGLRMPSQTGGPGAYHLHAN